MKTIFEPYANFAPCRNLPGKIFVANKFLCYALSGNGLRSTIEGGNRGRTRRRSRDEQVTERLAKTRSDFFRRLACLRASTCCGYALVNKGTDIRIIQGYLGYRSISSTVRYTKLDSRRFAKLF
jgi:hypothetical protein